MTLLFKLADLALTFGIAGQTVKLIVELWNE
jgi:hypothetical protein